MKNSVVALFLLLGIQVLAQENKVLQLSTSIETTDADKLTPAFHKERREAFRKIMPDSSVAIIYSNPVRNRNNDINFEFHQNPNLYYLTGVLQPNTMLIVFKEPHDFDGQQISEILFLQDKNPYQEVWDGTRLDPKTAAPLLLIEKVEANSLFSKVQLDPNSYTLVMLDVPVDLDLKEIEVKNSIEEMILQTQQKLGETNNVSLTKAEELLASLREIKKAEELELLQKAINITCSAIAEWTTTLEPGMKEYQAEAVIEFVFKHKGAEQAGFPTIAGSGKNSCILHYNTNRKVLDKTDLIICDVGAEYHGYTADVTRTLPVNGIFSPEQRAIYTIVLNAQQAGIDAAIQGAKFWDPHKAASWQVVDGLTKLGIIKDPSEMKRYFNHGTSHYLGLDVHDPGTYSSLKPGMVITVEPGIYIPEGSPCDPKWWNIGVRIEDDILITTSAPKVLSDCIPKTIVELEELMKKESIFNFIPGE